MKLFDDFYENHIIWQAIANITGTFSLKHLSDERPSTVFRSIFSVQKCLSEENLNQIWFIWLRFG